MILPLVSPSPSAHGTAAIRCSGRSIPGTDFEALLAQAGRIGSDIAALLGASVATGLPSPLPPTAGIAPTSAGGAGAGAGPLPHATSAAAGSGFPAAGVAQAGAVAAAIAAAAESSANVASGNIASGNVASDKVAWESIASGNVAWDKVASDQAGVAPAEATGAARSAEAAIPAVEHAAEGSGTFPGAGLPPGLAARLADGRLSPDSLPGRHADGRPGLGIDGRAGHPAAMPATPATPATGAEPGPATGAVPAVPAETGGRPASAVPSDQLAGVPGAAHRDAAPVPDTGRATLDGLRPEPGGSAAVGYQGPVTPHIAAASEAPETAAALPARIAELARRRSGTTEQVVIRLDPPELGSVRISLTARGDQVHVVVRADTPEARAALDAQRNNVEQLLRGEGFDLSSFDVGHQRREHEQHPSRRAGQQTRFAADLLDVPDTAAPATDGALRL